MTAAPVTSIKLLDNSIPTAVVVENDGLMLEVKLPIEAHSHVEAGELSDAKKWVVSPDFQLRSCIPMTMIELDSLVGFTERKRSWSPPSRRIAKSGEASFNKPSTICELFNKGSGSWTGYKRTYRYKGCGSKVHGMSSCINGKKA